MNVLEKILEENEMEVIKELTEENERCFKQRKGACSSTKNGICNCDDSVLIQAIQKIQRYLESTNNENDDWILVDKRLPEEDERYKGKKIIDVLVTTAKGKVTKVQRQSHNEYWW